MQEQNRPVLQVILTVQCSIQEELHHRLVVSTPLKNMKVTWDYYSQNMENQTNGQNHQSRTNGIMIIIIIIIIIVTTTTTRTTRTRTRTTTTTTTTTTLQLNTSPSPPRKHYSVKAACSRAEAAGGKLIPDGRCAIFCKSMRHLCAERMCMNKDMYMCVP